jgi:hypothetical protein
VEREANHEQRIMEDTRGDYIEGQCGRRRCWPYKEGDGGVGHGLGHDMTLICFSYLYVFQRDRSIETHIVKHLHNIGNIILNCMYSLGFKKVYT